VWKSRPRPGQKNSTLRDGGGAKRFVALARVSSREQEREGWSLEVQEEQLNEYAKNKGGGVTKLFKIAETASRADERKTFKELIQYARRNKATIDGVLFYKVDRAARNLFDYVDLERLESDENIPFISTSQPTANTPAGRVARRLLAIIAAFQTEQQVLDVRDGHQRRVEAGLFCGLAPYGYRNVRINARGLVEVSEPEARKVRLIYDLYAYKNHTIDMIMEHLRREGIAYLPSIPKWNRATVHRILRDRSYVGEVFYQDVWYPGTHEHLVDRQTWGRVQCLLGDKQRRSHELTFAGELIRCGHCGSPITGECVVKKATGRQYVYYRCVKYKSPGHPGTRLTEVELEAQVMAMFESIRLPDTVKEWFGRTLTLWSQGEQRATRSNTEDIQRQLSSLWTQKDRLLNLHLLGEISETEFSAKNTEIRDRVAQYTLKLEMADRGRDEHADLARKTFELSQSLTERWLTADYSAKRQMLETVCLNFSLDGASLAPEWRKPFDVLVKGLSVSSNRGDKIRTCDLLDPNQAL
jgi:site-specific DNA recombinase